jgi:N-acetylmuramoyl-L-alanine amidase
MPYLQGGQPAAKPADGPSTPVQPVGDGEYTVQQGDCIESLAAGSGHLWKTIWDHPRNAAVKSAREDPNILQPGDRLHIPPLRPRDENCATDKRHKFVRHGVPCMLRVRVQQGGYPRASERFVLTVEGKTTTGTTSSDGDIEVAIPPYASSARLVVGTGLHEVVYDLQLGGMDPIDTPRGIHKRLHNLGYCGPAEEGRYDGLEGAIAMFQKNHGMDATGECDGATRDKLREVHGS